MLESPVPRMHHLSHPWTTGYGVAASRLIRALADGGAGITWAPITFDNWHPLLPDTFASPADLADLRGTDEGAEVVVAHCIPELLRALSRDRKPGVALVISTVWEAERIQHHWPELLNRCDGVVVPTEWNAAAFRAAGVVVPVEVVPHAASSEVADLRWLEEVGADFVVHSIAAWTHRKDPAATVRAFCRAFGPDDGARLVLKTDLEIDHVLGAPPGPERRRWLSSWTVARILHEGAPAPTVKLVHGDLSGPQVAGLHARSDCWLSLPHAEGWDLGAFDAAVAGTPVVTVAHGGPLTYLDPEHSWLVPGALVDLPGLPGGVWIEPDMGAAAAALREIHADPQGARERAEKQGDRLRRVYAPDRVAAEFVSALRRMGIS